MARSTYQISAKEQATKRSTTWKRLSAHDGRYGNFERYPDCPRHSERSHSAVQTGATGEMLCSSEQAK
jgi:hypothetical protein